jgi:hypothetical protein
LKNKNVFLGHLLLAQGKILPTKNIYLFQNTSLPYGLYTLLGENVKKGGVDNNCLWSITPKTITLSNWLFI